MNAEKPDDVLVVNNPRLKMKTKAKGKPATNKTASDSGHIRQLHEFLDNVMFYAESPANWPLSQEEQLAFVRTVMFQANKLRKSEGYVTMALILASEDPAMAS